MSMTVVKSKEKDMRYFHSVTCCAPDETTQRGCRFFREYTKLEMEIWDDYVKGVIDKYDLFCRYKGKGGECYYEVEETAGDA